MSDVQIQEQQPAPVVTQQGVQIPVQATTVQAGGYPQQQPQFQPQFQAPPVQEPVVQEPVVKADANALIGNSPLETSINVFSANTGVSADRFVAAIQNALQYDDPNLIDKTALTQGLKGDKAAQAEALAQAMFQHAKSERATVQKVAYDLVGGQAQWTSAIEAFNNHAPAHIKAAALAMEQSGSTKEAVEFIVSQVQSYGVINSQQGNLIAPSGGTPNSANALSGSDFMKAVGELYQKAGNQLHAPRSPYAAELADLQKRRDLGKRQGL